MKLELKDYQKDCAELMMRNATGFMNNMDMGCLSGDAILSINRTGIGKKITLKDLYFKFNNIKVMGKRGILVPYGHGMWNSKYSTYTKSLCGDELRLHKIKAVVDSGVKDVFELELKSGKRLKMTADHEVAVGIDQWLCCSALKKGQQVLTNGVMGRKSSQVGSLNPNYKGGKFVDNDGYVRLSSYQGHQRSNYAGQIYEHIVVMENHLGRVVDRKETIHHLNENKQDNRIENLKIVTVSEHNILHNRKMNFDGKPNKHGDIIVITPKKDFVKSVKFIGREQVYDVVMEDPYRNFVANGIIVHNCGKTATTIHAVLELKCSKILVVCPGSLQLNWVDEWAKWSLVFQPGVGWDVRVISGTKKKKEKMVTSVGDHSVVIVGWDGLYNLAPLLAKYKPDVIIGDELHYSKSHKTKRYKGLKMIPSTYKFGLTGTPEPNSPLDIWSQFDWIRPGWLSPKFYAFRAKFADVYTGSGFPVIRKFVRQDELRKLISRFSYRITKEECLDLPEKIFQDIHIELSNKTKTVYSNMLDEMVAEVGGEVVAANTALVKLLRLRQITSGFVTDVDSREQQIGTEKIDALQDLLDSIPKHRVVVWCTFLKEIEMVHELCLKLGRKPYVLKGDVSLEDRHEAVHAFQENDEPSVLIANITVGGVGLNLTAAQYAVYYSRSFSFGHYDQSVDRLMRIGQVNKVTYYHLVCNKTIDMKIAKVLSNKEKMMDQLTGDDIRKIGNGD